MQQHNPKGRVVLEQLCSTAFSTLLDPDRWNEVRLKSVVDDCNCQPKVKNRC